LIRSLRRQLDFADIRRNGIKVVEKPFRLSAVVAPDSEVVTMGYAIPRSVGPAVVRNRLRRQLRAVMAEFDGAGRLPRGAFVVSVQPHEPLDYDEIRTRIGRLFGAVGARAT
jgi:ribonuclease P protein component